MNKIAWIPSAVEMADMIEAKLGLQVTIAECAVWPLDDAAQAWNAISTLPDSVQETLKQVVARHAG